MNKMVLIVDDDKKIANLISIRLKKQGFSTFVVHDGQSAIQWVENHEPSLVMLDVRLPDINGVDVLREVVKKRPEASVIMISAHADVQNAVECIKRGAIDFLEKPFEFTTFDAKVNQVFQQLLLKEEVANLKQELGISYKDKSLVGRSPGMVKVFQSIGLAAKSEVNVLIHGESGTGKELVARAIHFNGAQKQAPFMAVNCGAIPENLLESELFGHEKGAFTGASMRKLGKFEEAQNGTIFLDEIGEMPASLQVKLLRVLQEREVVRVGGTVSIPIQARFITATNRDLKKMVQEGKFREDLYYRINVFPIRLPPLRERKEDIPDLFLHFVKRNRKDKASVRTDEGALKRLKEYDWPGNIRELENFVERHLLLLGEKTHITEKDIHTMDGLSDMISSGQEIERPKDRTQVLGETEKTILEKALQDADGNIAKASKLVQMSRDSFYRKMKKYSIVR